MLKAVKEKKKIANTPILVDINQSERISINSSEDSSKTKKNKTGIYNCSKVRNQVLNDHLSVGSNVNSSDNFLN